MRIEELFKTSLRVQDRIIRRGLPAYSLKECARLVEVSPTKLANILGITRQRKRRYSIRAGEKIWRVVDLRREVSRLLGENRTYEFLKIPIADMNGKTPPDQTRRWIGACAVREMLNKPAHSTEAENDALRRHLAKVFDMH
jgi:uncharacterized protein (DUF2384 family)